MFSTGLADRNKALIVSVASSRFPVPEVLGFLQQNKLEKYCAAFQQHSIDGELLLAADDSVLKELGVKSAVDRVKIRTRFKTFASSKRPTHAVYNANS